MCLIAYAEDLVLLEAVCKHNNCDHAESSKYRAMTVHKSESGKGRAYALYLGNKTRGLLWTDHFWQDTESNRWGIWVSSWMLSCAAPVTMQENACSKGNVIQYITLIYTMVVKSMVCCAALVWTNSVKRANVRITRCMSVSSDSLKMTEKLSENSVSVYAPITKPH